MTVTIIDPSVIDYLEQLENKSGLTPQAAIESILWQKIIQAESLLEIESRLE